MDILGKVISESILGENPNYEENHLTAIEPINVEAIPLSTAFQRKVNLFAAPTNVLSVEEMIRIDPSYRPPPKAEKPRRLTEKEIVEAMHLLDLIDCIDSDMSELITEQYREIFTEILIRSETEMVVNEGSFRMLFDMMNRKMKEALSYHGERYGNLASFGISCNETQVSLKLKKNTGAGSSSVMKNDIDYIKSIHHATKRPNYSYVSLHFIRKMKYRELIDFTYQIKHITIADLLTKEEYTIGRLEADDVEPGFTHEFHKNEGIFYDGVYCMRLHFNKDKLFAHKLTPYDISMLLRKNTNIAEETRMIPSTFEEAYIDVVATSSLNGSDLGDAADISNLKYVSYPKIRGYQIQGGVPGVSAASVKRNGYQTFFYPSVREPRLKEKKEYKGEYDVLEFDLNTMASFMFPRLDFIEESLKKAGVVIMHRFKTRQAERVYAYAVQKNAFNRTVKPIEFARRYGIPKERITSRAGKFSIHDSPTIAKLLERDGLQFTVKEDVIELEIPRIETISDAFAYLDDLDSHYCYVETEGTFINTKVNILRSFSIFAEIDFSRFATNSLPLMNKFFGCEVCRNYEIFAIAENQKAKNSRSQTRFTILLADHMNFWGIPLGTDFYQNAKKPDNDFIIIGDYSHTKQIMDTYANKNSTASTATTSAGVLVTGQIRAGDKIIPVINPTEESLMTVLRTNPVAKRITEFDLNEILKKRIEGIVEDVGSNLNTVEREMLSVKPVMMKTLAEMLPTSIAAAPVRREDFDFMPDLNNSISPYAKNLEIDIPSTLLKVAPLRTSIIPVQFKDVVALVQRKTSYPIAIDLSNFLPKRGKKQIMYGRAIKNPKDSADADIEIFFNPLDFLDEPKWTFKVSDTKFDPDELK